MDDRIAEKMQSFGENWDRTTLALKVLPKEISPDFSQAVRFFLETQFNDFWGQMHRMALQIDRLGFDSQPFLKEKEERFKVMKGEVFSLVTTVVGDADGSTDVSLFGRSGKT